jgi:hypothetical protein
MRVLILTIALLAYALPAVACDYQASGSGSSTTTATSTPPSAAYGSGG